MKRKPFLVILFVVVFNTILFSQTILNIDDYITSKRQSLSQVPAKIGSLEQEVQVVEELTSTINALLLENGEKINIALQRGVPCLKADADISTFLKYTQLETNKKEIISACKDIKLIRFSFYSESDFKMAKSIDLSILDQFTQLKYLVLYVDPSVFQELLPAQQRDKVEFLLKELFGKQIESQQLKLFYRIPIVG